MRRSIRQRAVGVADVSGYLDESRAFCIGRRDRAWRVAVVHRSFLRVDWRIHTCALGRWAKAWWNLEPVDARTIGHRRKPGQSDTRQHGAFPDYSIAAAWTSMRMVRLARSVWTQRT